MCLFPSYNQNQNSSAARKGLQYFSCGACPECLAKRSRDWALRTVFEAKNSPACMVTLTYDQYIYDDKGNIIGETVSDKHVNKRDCQLFIKRLRKHFTGKKIKYLITAEYGKRTHRPHYHALLFGVIWPDLVYYKKSKRGNIIYTSNLLTKLWNSGICTVDCINMSAKVARYCTKYCAKDARADDTFMLVSRGIGEEQLLKEFNGESYWVDGRQYPIPRQIWQKYITAKYSDLSDEFTYKYVNKTGDNWSEYYDNVKKRRKYMSLRDSDNLYIHYLDFWKKKSEQYERNRPSEVRRILALPDNKYFAYKQAALRAYNERQRSIPRIPPRSNCKKEYFCWLESHLPVCSCHERANDTIESMIFLQDVTFFEKEWKNCPFGIDKVKKL